MLRRDVSMQKKETRIESTRGDHLSLMIHNIAPRMCRPRGHSLTNWHLSYINMKVPKGM